MGDVTLVNMQKIIEFVRDYTKREHISPSLEEIAVGIGKRPEDVGNISPMIDKLVQERFLERLGKYRGLRVPKKLPRRYYYRRERE